MENYNLFLMTYCMDYWKLAKGNNYEELKESILEAEKYFNSKGIEEFFCSDIELKKHELTDFIYQECYHSILEKIKELEENNIDEIDRKKIRVGIDNGLSIKEWEDNIIIFDEEEPQNVFYDLLEQLGTEQETLNTMSALFYWISRENRIEFLNLNYDIKYYNKNGNRFFYQTF